LEQAQAALFSAGMSSMKTSNSMEQLAFARAKRALADAEEKLHRIKHWNREFDNQAEPLVRQLEKLHTLLSHDLINAIGYLKEVTDTLDKYAAGPAPDAAAVQAGAETAKEPAS
jgi:hypothetical protein